MGIGLGPVAELAARGWVVLLGQQAGGAGLGQNFLEQAFGVRPASNQVQGFRQPAGAQEEASLEARQAIVEAVAIDDGAEAQMALHLLHGGDVALIARVQHAVQPHDQHRRIQVLLAVGLGAGAGFGVPAPLQHLRPDFPGGGLPAGDWPLQGALLPRRGGAQRLADARGAIQRHPAHDFGVDMVARRAAFLPNAVIGQRPKAQRGIGHAFRQAPERLLRHRIGI